MKKALYIFIGVIVLNTVLGGWSIDCILNWLGKDIPFFFDMIIGLFIAELSVPVAIIGQILRAFGVF
jgi:hypothetical protein